MLADAVDFVIGVDTHRDNHTAVIVNPAGAIRSEITVVADPRGYGRLLRFAEQSAPGRRCWAIEGTGSFGAGLTAFLLDHGERVVEIDRPKRPARRNGAKSDRLDAGRAACEALRREHLASPRQRGRREAIRVLLGTRESAMAARTKAITHLKALLVSAPSELRRTSATTAPPDSSPAAPACALQQAATSSVRPRSSPCAQRPGAHSRCKPKPTRSNTNSRRSSPKPPPR